MIRKFVGSRFVQFASVAALGTLVPGSFLTLPAQAGQLQDGRSFFDHAPRLVRTASTFQSTDIPSTYQFTVKVPEDAGASLQAVRISQDGDRNNVDFNVSRSSAFLGNSFAGGPAVSLANIGGNAPNDANEVTIVFEKPVEPGQTVTVSLESDRNPPDEGIYQFGVTAFPQGDNSVGIPLGYGRVSIYDNAR